MVSFSSRRQFTSLAHHEQVGAILTGTPGKPTVDEPSWEGRNPEKEGEPHDGCPVRTA